MELPLHLVRSMKIKELKDHMLLNLDWLMTKLRAASFRWILVLSMLSQKIAVTTSDKSMTFLFVFLTRDVADDFHLARNSFPDDTEIKTVASLMQMCRDAVTAEPAELPAQVLSRVDDSSVRKRQS